MFSGCPEHQAEVAEHFGNIEKRIRDVISFTHTALIFFKVWVSMI